MDIRRKLIIGLALLVTVVLLHLIYSYTAMDSDRWIFSVEAERALGKAVKARGEVSPEVLRQLAQAHEIVIPEGGIRLETEGWVTVLHLTIHQQLYGYRTERTLQVSYPPKGAARRPTANRR